MTLTPFADLTPERILDAVESVGLLPDGRMLALNSYENRVYQIGLDAGPMMIVKFYRANRWSDGAIAEEHAYAAELAARELPVVAPIVIDDRSLHHHDGLRFALFERVGGRAPELNDPATLSWMGRFLGRIHAVGALENYRNRPTLDIHSFGEEPREWLLSHDFIPPDLLPAWRSTVDQTLERVRQCYERAGEPTLLRLHGDCHGGNVLWDDNAIIPGPHFVDFDDSCMGPAVQDLWMLLSGDRREMGIQLGDVLAGYEDFHDFSLRELHLVEALRSLRLLHYSAWIARRWDDPAFPAAFPWFNTPRYWQDRILELREQIALMDEPPLWST